MKQICTLVLFILTSQLYAQPVTKKYKLKPVHKEQQENPYLPNEFNNMLTSPAYKYGSGGPEFRSTGSSIFTTQVNVNPAGNNILGDAANEPSIAVHDNNIVIGWRQFNNISSSFRQAGWAWSHDAGQTWNFPGVIEPGIFRSDPVLDHHNNGNFYYNSLHSDVNGNFFCKVFKSTDGGMTWDLGTDAWGGDKQWMAIDRSNGMGSGNIYSFWTSNFSICMPGFFTRSPDNGLTYDSCVVVDGDPKWGTLEVGNDGDVYLCGYNFSGDIIFTRSSDAQVPASQLSWTPAVAVNMDGMLSSSMVNPAGLIGQVNIALDQTSQPFLENVYLLASIGRLSLFDEADVMFARSTDGGATWDAPVRVNDDSSNSNVQWLSAMSVAPNGRIDAVWLDTRDSPPGTDSTALYYSYSLDYGNTWSVNERMSPLFDPHAGYPNQDKMGDYIDIASENAGAHVAWTGTMTGGQDVYYSFIQPAVATAIEEHLNDDMLLYPNPTTGKIILIGSGGSRLEIYSLLGKSVFSVFVTSDQEEIDISELSNGIYIMRLVHGEKNISTKIARE